MEEQEVVPAEAAEEVPEVVEEETPAEVVEPTEVAEVPPEPRKKTAQERIDEITRARREAEREREYWKKVALERERPPEPTPATPQGPKRPTLEQFETTVEYEDALFEWRDRVRDLKGAEIAQRTQEETALREFNRKAAKLRSENPDFDDVIEAPVFSPSMRKVLLESDNGPEVAYFLGREENRDQAERIRNLPADRQAYEIGKLESNLLLAKKTRKVPSAPEPIKPVGMGGGGKEKDPSEMSTTEWMAWDKQRTLEKLKARYG